MWRFCENTISREDGNAMKEFIAKHKEEIAGVLSGFDRLVFRGTLRSISYPEGMMGYLGANQVRLTEFGRHLQGVSEQVKQACKAQAEVLGRPVKYLVSAGESKEEVAREIVAREPGEAEAGVGVAHAEMPVSVSLLDAPGVWIFACAAANVVSIFHAGV